MATVLTEENFESEVKNSKGLYFVDFWAEWCGPCQAMLPVFEAFGEEMSDKVSVGKVNVDEAQAIAQSHRVMSIPTLILFKDGEPVEQLIGAQNKEQLQETVEKHL
jgi:thioredoxin 1